MWPKDETFGKARDEAVKALSLDDSLVEAHTALGGVKFFHEWDIPGAEKEFQKATGLRRNIPRAGYVNMIIYLVLVGRFDEAIAIQKWVIDSNPLYPDYANLSFIYTYARRYDEAIAAARKCIELNIDAQFARISLIILFGMKKSCVEAVSEISKYLADFPAASSDPSFATSIGLASAACGNRKLAEEYLKIIKEGISKKPSEIDSVWLSYIYSPLGEKDLAISALQDGYQKRSPMLLWLKVEPIFDPLRDDPRFQELLKKVGFEN